jgi:HEAT repeat protein
MNAFPLAMAAGLALVAPVLASERPPSTAVSHQTNPASQNPPAGSAASAAWQDVIRNLRHPDSKVRLSAVEQLGGAGYTAAAEYVAPLVSDPDDRVQFAAIDAELTFFLVESVSDRRVFSMNGGSRSRAQEAFDGGPLVRAADPAPLVVIDNLITAMRDQNARVRFDAVHALGVIAEAPLPAAQARGLIDGLDHYDPIMRAASARVIGRLHVVDAGDKLIAGLNDSNRLVRRYAAEALGQIRDERAVQSLTELAEYYRRDDLGASMITGLAGIAHGSSRDLFRSRLADGDAAVRRACAEGLGRLRDRDAREQLTALAAKDPSAAVRLAATFAVGLIDQPQPHLVAGALAVPDTAVQAAGYLIEMGHASVPGLQAALAVAKDTVYRTNVLHVLGFVGAGADAAIAEPFTKDKEERVARAAAAAIARIRRAG